MPFPIYQTQPPPAFAMPAPTYAPSPVAAGWQPAPSAPRATQPVLAAQAATLNQPTFRGAGPEPKPAVAPPPRAPLQPIALPSPRELGLGPAPTGATPARLDWNDAVARLQRVGASGFRLDPLPQGGARFSVVLPTADPGRTRTLEAVGRTETDAVLDVLRQAER